MAIGTQRKLLYGNPGVSIPNSPIKQQQVAQSSCFQSTFELRVRILEALQSPHLRPKDKFAMPTCRQHPPSDSLPDRTFSAVLNLTRGQVLQPLLSLWLSPPSRPDRFSWMEGVALEFCGTAWLLSDPTYCYHPFFLPLQQL